MQKSTRNYDLSKVIKPEHEGKWVALNRDRTEVVDYSESFDELEQRVGRVGVTYMKAFLRGTRHAF